MLWKLIWGTFGCVLLCFYLNPTLATPSVLLNGCIFSLEKNEVAITLSFSDKVKYHCMLLNNPNRFVVDISHVSLKTKLTPSSDNSLIKGVRTSDHNDYLRLVFDLKKVARYRAIYSERDNVLTLKLAAEDGDKTEVIEAPAIVMKDPLDKIENHLEVAKKAEEPLKIAKNLVVPPELPAQVDNHEKSKNIVIVIDPGHGGKDPGATGQEGTLEKEVVLKISKQLQSMLNEEPGFCAVLTRSTDYYIPLRKRLAIARKNHADLFIAIHADAYHHSHATGASVYALSQRGATSEAAKWLAEKENESELGGLSDELADKDAILRSVLIDLSQTHTIEASLQVGNAALSNLAKFSTLHHPKVEQAAFVVLKSPDIPSILVETGFLSNPEEEQKLKDPTYQHKTALAIKEGIKHYFTTNSPGGTWFSDHRSKAKEIVLSEEEKPVKSVKTKHRRFLKHSAKIG